MGLLSRGSQVRVLPGALFSEEFADFAPKNISGRTHIEQSDRSGEFAPHSREFAIVDSRRNSHHPEFSRI
jgi:hypothetical protein